MKGRLIAVDFDGTCVTHDYPRVGSDIGAVPVLRHLVENGDRLILWTMRSGLELQAAVEWFAVWGISLYAINSNPEQTAWTDSPKAYAHIYIDDAAFGAPLITGQHSRPFMDWAKVAESLIQSDEATQ